MKLTIIYPYRNRDLERVQRSMDSLARQSNLDFKVYFIDYGSDINRGGQVEDLVSKYDFATYAYLYSQNQPWNKSKAINFALTSIETPFCFIADIDMIFDVQFIEVVNKEIQFNPNKTIFFQIGYLSKEQTKNFLSFNLVLEYTCSSPEATGMSLFNTEQLKSVKGFDEFFHFWGAEDTDVHNRLKLAGYEVFFYDKKVLLLHQWHPSYRSGEKYSLTKDLQCTGIVQLNQEHLNDNRENNRVITRSSFGKSISKENFDVLISKIPSLIVQNEVQEIDHFLFYTLPNLKKGVYRFDFKQDVFQNTIKYKIKKIIKKKVPQYYSLKQVNDMLLKHIIGFYHQYPYQVVVADDLQKIIFTIIKEE